MVSRKVVERLSLYRRLLTAQSDDGVGYIYSHELAEMAVVSAAQVRRDLMEIGYHGTSHRGYDVDRFLASIDAYLDGPTPQKVALVGVGELGHAVMTLFAGTRPTLTIVAAFDLDPNRVGTRIGGVRCQDAARIAEILPAQGIHIALITTSNANEQEIADELVAGGVFSIVNFSGGRIHVPDHVFVEKVDITAAVEAATYFAHVQDDVMTGNVSATG